ncbi:GGDEF domain-containing protein [Blastopirellula marina]|uniref:diguanylate cyclase n=1 Tax=Blastopirellula marina TaxID=124 RepID=A0A2S8FHE5_9BACT|nr:GGDEF domain-containing protein [Blastopirellula marina]PQO31611.1 hypothetical protein C5Y98_19540 [Blastopirellula marina]PTL42918.1 GGDEF domain-containing protein [Blastopirellula marina]
MPEFTLIHALQCGLFFGIGFLASAWLNLSTGLKSGANVLEQETKIEPSENDDDASELADMVQSVVENVQTLADGMRTDVHEHSQSVERINDDLTTISGVADVEGVARVIAHLIEANRHLDTRLNVAETRLMEQSHQLRSHRVEARTDALTGLPNRRVFDEGLQRLFDNRQRLQEPASLIMIDIDHFKEFNDRRGHQAGDACLRAVGEVIRQAVQPLGGVVVRYGGEEFAVLFPNTEIFDAKIAAQRINHKIEKMLLEFEKAKLSVTVSLGVAELFHDATPADWLSRADRALYDAKRRGRNRACWHDCYGCHEVPKGADKSCGENEPEVSSARDEFLRDIDRRLAMFHRQQEPIGLFIVRIDPIDEQVAIGQEDFHAIESGIYLATKGLLRDMDHVCRLSKMQFGALLPTADEAATAVVAQRTCEAVNQLKFETSNGVVQVTVTCGVAEAMEGDDAKRFMARAESCVERGSDQGGNVVLCACDDFVSLVPEQDSTTPVIAE